MSKHLAFSIAVAALSGAATTASAQSRPDWFQMPTTSALRQSTKKVFAQYMNFPLQINNLPFDKDYYTTQYLNPNGESGRWAFCGGLLRDRPLEVPGAGKNRPNWQFENMKTEIRRAIADGLDGFEYYLLAWDGTHVSHLQLLLNAAQSVDPNFKIRLTPDMYAQQKNPGGIYNVLLNLRNYPALERTPDGRIVLSPYLPNYQGLAWWKTMTARWNAIGVRVSLRPCFQTYKNYVNEWAPFCDGILNWGNDQSSDAKKVMAATGLKSYGNTVYPQYMAPRKTYFRETKGSAAYRKNWQALIANDIDWVSVQTWNDYGESSHIAPSVQSGTTFYEMTAYYATWFKTGTQPTVTKDRFFLLQRAQAASSTTASKGTAQVSTDVDTVSATVGRAQSAAAVALKTAADPFVSPDTPVDEVELTGFLTAAARLEVQMGTKTYGIDATKGINSMRFPLSKDRPVIRVYRGSRLVGTINAPYTASDAGTSPDLAYRGYAFGIGG